MQGHEFFLRSEVWPGLTRRGSVAVAASPISFPLFQGTCPLELFGWMVSLSCMISLHVRGLITFRYSVRFQTTSEEARLLSVMRIGAHDPARQSQRRRHPDTIAAVLILYSPSAGTEARVSDFPARPRAERSWRVCSLWTRQADRFYWRSSRAAVCRSTLFQVQRWRHRDHL